ncbi:acetate--CoA ligase family protein [Nakamurella flava]|uniref:Acetate--CoA ligase family protein n=1 Tax=Nakamurella flava TaxID=2576308 RepID=A0A4U6QNY1_9ACTN|nr:acetate--CoA ligase family protein [Nakamurella flava]TKV61772.1 acetate--CoA ligase family protein [Nakamurella flava]
MPADLQPLFRPGRVAVIGASRGGGKLGAVMARSLAGYAGGVALVNARSADPAAGIHPSVAAAVAAEGPIDLAVFCVPAAVTAAGLAEAADAGVRAAVVCAGGFAEAGGPGLGHQADVEAVVAATGLRLLGPNTSGFFVPGRGLTASFVPGVERIPAGRVAVVAASGGVNHALSFQLAGSGVGISLGVGLGLGVGVGTADVLHHLATDPETAAVALHLETVVDGPGLLAAVTTLSAVKPVVALVVGRTDVGEFARSHTGALATSWKTTRAVLRQAGAVVVDDERALLDAVTGLSGRRLPPHPCPGLALVTGQAGPGLLVADAVASAGGRLPTLTDATQARLRDLLPPLTYQANPVDTGRPGPGFADVLATVAADPGVDLVAVYGLAEPDVVDLPAAAAQAGLPDVAPTVLGTGGLPADVQTVVRSATALDLPTVASPSALATATMALVQDAVARHRRQDPPTPRPRAWTRGPWDEDQAKTLLDDWGIATPPRMRCLDREQAETALDCVPGPVAVKILDAAVLHKTEIGGVHLGVRTAEELAAALDRLADIGAKQFLVEAMAPSGVDLVVGVRRDPVFGPVALVGLGGTAAEAYGDVAIRALPAGPAEIAAMVDDLQAAALLDGWRGGPVLDRGDLVTVVTALGDALLSAPDVAEIEINPLRLTVDGLIALDAVIVPVSPVPDDTDSPTIESEVDHAPAHH